MGPVPGWWWGGNVRSYIHICDNMEEAMLACSLNIPVDASVSPAWAACQTFPAPLPPVLLGVSGGKRTGGLHRTAARWSWDVPSEAAREGTNAASGVTEPARGRDGVADARQ